MSITTETNEVRHFATTHGEGERREAGDMNAVTHDPWHHVPLTRQAKYIWRQFYPRTFWREAVRKIIRDLIAGRMNARNARGGGHRSKKRLHAIKNLLRTK